jgi:hypothetical protein
MPDIKYIRFKDRNGHITEIPKDSFQRAKKERGTNLYTVSASWEISEQKHQALSKELSSNNTTKGGYTVHISFHDIQGHQIGISKQSILGFDTSNKNHVKLIAMWYVNKKVYNVVDNIVRSRWTNVSI